MECGSCSQLSSGYYCYYCCCCSCQHHQKFFQKCLARLIRSRREKKETFLLLSSQINFSAIRHLIPAGLTLSGDKVSPKKGYKLFIGTTLKPKTSLIEWCGSFYDSQSDFRKFFKSQWESSNQWLFLLSRGHGAQLSRRALTICFCLFVRCRTGTRRNRIQIG